MTFEIESQFADLARSLEKTGLRSFAAAPGSGESALTAPSSSTRVLFVCIENANRSQMAQAFARLHGGPTVEAHSAGSNPSGQINAKAVEAMRELGYDLNTHESKSLADIPDVEYDVVVSMGCGDACPSVRAVRREDWNIPDPKEFSPERFREVRDLIEAKVKDLLAGLRIQRGAV